VATKAAPTARAASARPERPIRTTKSGAPRKSTRKAQAREEDIYRAAAQIFHRKGYAATSLKDIADEVGLLKGSLYHYIDSKEEDLLYGITNAIHDMALGLLEMVEEHDGSPKERLSFLVEEHVARMGRNLELIRVFYTDYGALSPDRRATVMGERRAYETFVQDLIEAGQANGEFCPDLDPLILRNGILTMANTVYMWFHEGHGLTIEDIAKGYATFLIRGLECPADHVHRRPRKRAKATKP
jgi:AcrR family transcriptional regulator